MPGADSIAQSYPFPRIGDVDNLTREEFRNLGLTPPFHGKCRCEMVLLWASQTSSTSQTGDLTLYHGTSSQYVNSIKEHGLIPGKKEGAASWATKNGWSVAKYDVGNREVSVFLTADKKLAGLYAERAAEVSGGRAVITRVTIPKSQASKLVRDEQDLKGLRFKRKIEPSWIDFDDVKVSDVAKKDEGSEGIKIDMIALVQR